MNSKKINTDKIKIIKLSQNIFQIEVGKKAVVTKALNPFEALKNACKYLGISCNKLILKDQQ
jgi:hypothetical protein